MSEEKFTKGEWIAIVDAESCFIDTVEHGLLADLFDTDAPAVESDANAHLIAAAPEMYGILRQIQIEGGLSVARHKSVANILAKARGEHD